MQRSEEFFNEIMLALSRRYLNLAGLRKKSLRLSDGQNRKTERMARFFIGNS